MRLTIQFFMGNLIFDKERRIPNIGSSFNSSQQYSGEQQTSVREKRSTVWKSTANVNDVKRKVINQFSSSEGRKDLEELYGFLCNKKVQMCSSEYFTKNEKEISEDPIENSKFFSKQDFLQETCSGTDNTNIEKFRKRMKIQKRKLIIERIFII